MTRGIVGIHSRESMFGLPVLGTLLVACAVGVTSAAPPAAQVEPRPERREIARSPRGELWLPLAGPPCDPSGRYLRLAKRRSAAASDLAPEEQEWALDTEAAGGLLPGSPWLPADLPPVEAPGLFPPPADRPPLPPDVAALAAELDAELEAWPGSLWYLALARASGAHGERPLFLVDPHTRVRRPLGALRGAASLARLDAPRRRVLLCEIEPEVGSSLAWLPIDAPPPEAAPRWFEEDEAAAREHAAAEGRPIFAALRVPKRALGEFLESRTLADARVRAELHRGYVALKLDAHARRERFEQLFGERGALGCAVLAADGDAIAVRKGFLEPELLLEFLAEAEALAPRWYAARARFRECPRDEAARLAFARARLAGGDAVGAEPLLWDLLCDAAPLARAEAHAELARLEIDRGRVQEALAHLARYRALDPEDRAGARARADLAAAILARARRRPAQAARLLEETFVYAPVDFEMPLRMIELSLAWHEEGDQALGKRGLETVARRYAGTIYGGQAEACLQHMSVPHGH